MKHPAFRKFDGTSIKADFSNRRIMIGFADSNELIPDTNPVPPTGARLFVFDAFAEDGKRFTVAFDFEDQTYAFVGTRLAGGLQLIQFELCILGLLNEVQLMVAAGVARLT